MSVIPSDMHPGTWQVPECPLLIEYSPAILDEIRLAVVDAFFSLPRGGAEVGGVLFGSHDGRRVRITAFRPMDCEHAMGPTFVLSEKDQARLRAQLEASRKDPLLGDLEIVGWYHSHTRSDIFLSQLDLEIYSQFFPKPWQVALVMRPAGMKPLRAGFFFRDAHGEIHSAASYHEFIVGAGDMSVHAGNGSPAEAAAPRPKPKLPADPLKVPSNGDSTARVVESAPLPIPANPAAETRPAEFVPPAFMILPERRPVRAGPWLALLLLAGAGATAYFTSDYWMKALYVKPAYLHLQALDHDGQLRIQWDGAPLAAGNVQSGSLEIVDGAHATTIPLDGAKLRAGSYQYERRTGIVEAHLSVRTGQEPPLEEFTTFYGQPPKASSSPDPTQQNQAPDPAAVADDLKKPEPRSTDLTRKEMRRELERKQLENQVAAANPAAPQPAQPSLSGRWVYSPASKSGSPYPPESATLGLAEAQGHVRGIFAGRYKVPKNKKMKSRVEFNFGGPLSAGLSRFTFTAADGTKGEIQLIRLPGKQDAIEVVWYSEREKLTFDDVFFRVP
jgi:proteasome lid subunit RPN8/RPN11